MPQRSILDSRKTIPYVRPSPFAKDDGRLLAGEAPALQHFSNGRGDLIAGATARSAIAPYH